MFFFLTRPLWQVLQLAEMLIFLGFFFKNVFESNGHFGKYSNKPSRAGGGVLGEGVILYNNDFSSMLYALDPLSAMLYAL